MMGLRWMALLRGWMTSMYIWLSLLKEKIGHFHQLQRMIDNSAMDFLIWIWLRIWVSRLRVWTVFGASPEKIQKASFTLSCINGIKPVTMVLTRARAG